MTKWIGLEEVKRRFREMPNHSRATVYAAGIQNAQELVAMQKRLVEVDDGDLRDAIHYEVRPGGAFDFLIIVRAKSDKVSYAHHVEFGTAPHVVGGRFAGAMHPGTPARPFFFPAYRALRRSMKNRYRRAFRKAVAGSSQ